MDKAGLWIGCAGTVVGILLLTGGVLLRLRIRLRRVRIAARGGLIVGRPVLLPERQRCEALSESIAARQRMRIYGRRLA